MQLVIVNTEIKQDSEGRYCLNDLHVAAGGEKKHGPSYWMQSNQTKELIAELGDTGNPVSVIKGGNEQGTYVSKELVYAYAMWISPSFNLKVIRAYDAMMSIPPVDPITALLAVAQLTHEKTLQLERKQNILHAELERHGQAILHLNSKKTTTEDEYFTVTGYGRLIGQTYTLTEASKHGLAATKMSEGLSVPVLKVRDSRFGFVNSYHQDVLREIIGIGIV